MRFRTKRGGGLCGQLGLIRLLLACIRVSAVRIWPGIDRLKVFGLALEGSADQSELRLIPSCGSC